MFAANNRRSSPFIFHLSRFGVRSGGGRKFRTHVSLSRREGGGGSAERGEKKKKTEEKMEEKEEEEEEKEDDEERDVLAKWEVDNVVFKCGDRVYKMRLGE